MVDKPIESLINDNYVYAKVLDYFGVAFYESRKKTLRQVCQEYEIDEQKLASVLEKTSNRSNPHQLNFRDYPSVLIIEYLKHAHQVFVKEKLPYLARMIESLPLDATIEITEDLKAVFPLFVNDFINHIHEEEDRLFTYIITLEQFLKSGRKRSKVQSIMNSFSIQQFALHHDHSDTELKGIRGITNHFDTRLIHDLQLKVIFKELQQFDQELLVHANIENNILFPQALNLEKKVNHLLHSKISFN